MSARKRIAVIAPNWLGDAVMSLPLLGMLGATGARLSVISSPYVARVYAGIGDVDEMVVDRPRRRLRRIVARARVLDAMAPDAVAVLPPSFSSALGALLGSVAVRVGYAADARAALLTDALPTKGARGEHLSVNYRRLGERLLERLEIPAPSRWPPPAPWVGRDDAEEARGVLSAAAVDGDAYAVVVPGAEYGPAKSWPEARFEALCDLLSRDTAVVLTGSARERELCDRIAAGRSRIHNVAGETSLGGFFALLERAAVVVANDSGSPHAAAALGVPTVVLFGSTSPVWTAPQGSDVEVVQHPVPCNPCFGRTCPTELECFNGIDPRDVYERVKRVARRVQP